MKDRTIVMLWFATLLTAALGMNLAAKGPDSTVTLAVVAAIVSIASYAVGRKTP